MRKLLAVVVFLGLSHDLAHAQCPVSIPNPANKFDVDCFSVGKPVGQRCATAINPTACNALNTRGENLGLLTSDGYAEVVAIKFCAMVMDLGLGDGPLIYDFCPMGCFATDTRVLTGVTGDGKASYAPAAAMLPQGTLMSMTDDAGLHDVVLAPQPVKRIVYGPEDSKLFVFALANGSTLRVTEHHPMVLHNGRIVEARKVDSRMSFIGLDGRPVAIRAITREKAIGDVFNFETAGETQLNHIIVAEGVLVGDLKLQDELETEQNSIELRR